MATKATNRGTCQWCGRVQMLPNGRLAKHGYTVRYSFFEGTCRGSDELPMEVSCDLVKQSIVWATTSREQTVAHAATERESRDLDVLATLYLSGWSRSMKSGYYWKQVRVVGWEATRREIRVVDAVTGERVQGDRDGRIHSGHLAYDYSRPSSSITIEDAANALHILYATRLDQQAEELRQYIHQQTLTVQVWEPRPLLPLK